MSNQKKAALSFKHVTPQLANLVEGVLGEAAKHTFSVSRLYAAYNGALQKNDKPQTCSSCLRNRAAELKKWYAEYKTSKGKRVAADEQGAEDQNDGEVLFTPEEEGAQYGIATKGGVPLPAGNYAHGDQQYAVNGDEGRYTVITGEPAGDAAQAEAEAAYYAKLADLGAVMYESTDAEMLEALEVLSTSEGITEQEAAFYARTIEQINKHIAESGEGDGPHTVNTDGGLRLAEKGAQGIKFVPNEGEPNKGTVTYADGTKLRAGTYALADGRDLAVQVTGKATIKEEDLT